MCVTWLVFPFITVRAKGMYKTLNDSSDIQWCIFTFVMHSQCVIFVRLYVKMCHMKGQVVHVMLMLLLHTYVIEDAPHDKRSFLSFAESDRVCPKVTTHKA